MENNIYILHDFDGRPYYKALDENFNLIYLNTRPFRFLIRDLIKYKKIKKDTIMSFLYLFIFPFFNNKNIILAMAPYNLRILFYGFLVYKNNVYYHTSWPYWNGPVPFGLPSFGSRMVLFFWRYILNKCTDKVAVTHGARLSLSGFLNNDVLHIPHSVDVEKISLKNLQFKFSRVRKHIGYLGRLDESKGINTFIEIFHEFKDSSDIKFFCAGHGPYKNRIIELTDRYNNIDYLGYISDRKLIRSYLSDLDILLVPSIKNHKWEELFGLVVIEAMSQGVLVISTDHIGPVSIIDNDSDGLIFSESLFTQNCIDVLNKDKSTYIKYAINAIDKSRCFEISSVFEKWRQCLNG